MAGIVHDDAVPSSFCSLPAAALLAKPVHVREWSSDGTFATHVFDGKAGAGSLIYQDDNIRIAQQKVCERLQGIEISSVVVWGDQRPPTGEDWVMDLSIQVMRGRKRVHQSILADLKEYLHLPIGRETDTTEKKSGGDAQSSDDEEEEEEEDDDEVIVADDGEREEEEEEQEVGDSTEYYSLEDLVTILEPLRYVDAVPVSLGTRRLFPDNYMHYGPVSPLDIRANTTPPDGLVVVQNTTYTLESYGLSDDVINVMSRTALEELLEKRSLPKAWVEYFFPLTSAAPASQQDDDTRDTMRRAQDIIDDFHAQLPSLAKLALNHACGVAFAHVRLSHTASATPPLQDMYNRLRTSEDCPCIKFVTPSDVMYKLNTQAINNDADAEVSISKRMLDTWTQPPKAGRGRKYIELMIVTNFKSGAKASPEFVSMLIPETAGTVELYYEPVRYAQRTTSLDDIARSRPAVNAMLARLQLVWPDMTFRLSSSYLTSVQESDAVHLVDMHVNLQLHTHNVRPVAKNIRKIIDAAFPLLETDPTHNQDTELHFHYVRVNNFLYASGMSEFLNKLAKRHGLSDEDRASMMTEQFSGLSFQQALQKVRTWRSEKHVRAHRVGQTYEVHAHAGHGIEIRTSVHELGFVTLRGITNLRYVPRVIHTMYYLLFNSQDGVFEKQNFGSQKSIGSAYADAISSQAETRPGPSSPVAAQQQDAATNDYRNDANDGYNDISALLKDGEEQDRGQEKNAPPPSTDEAPSEPREAAGRFDYLTSLRKFDSNLFHQKGYAERCQGHRQPVVVTAAELGKLNPMSYSKEVLAYRGSLASGNASNMYICPDVWCPISRTAIERSDFEQGKKKCPVADEEPMLRYSSNADTFKFPGFIGSVQEPTPCLPCCFKKNQKATGHPRYTQCTTGSEDHRNLPATAKGSLAAYIKGPTKFPLDAGMYGELPGCLQIHLPSTDLHVDGMLVRKGIKNNSFVNCMNEFLQRDTMQAVLNNLSVETFMTLNNGTLISMFVDDTMQITSRRDWTSFREWLCDHDNTQASDYVLTFNLYDVRDRVERITEVPTAVADLKFCLREFVIFGAFRNFIMYLRDERYEKSEDVLLDLYNRKYAWLNPDGHHFIVCDIEWDASADEQCRASFICAQNMQYKKTFALMVKQRRGNRVYYEPVYRYQKVSSKQSKGTHATIYRKNQRTCIFIDDGDSSNAFAPASHIINLYKRYATIPPPEHAAKVYDARRIMAYMRSMRYTILHQVIDYRFKLVGLIVKSRTCASKTSFLPMREQQPILSYSLNVPTRAVIEKPSSGVCVDDEQLIDADVTSMYCQSYIFTDQLVEMLVMCPSSNTKYVTEIKNLLSALRSVTEDDFYVFEEVWLKGALVGLRNKYQNMVPLAKEMIPRELYLDNFNIFVGDNTSPLLDPATTNHRYAAFEDQLRMEQAFRALHRTMLDVIQTSDRDTVRKLAFIGWSHNAFPYGVKKAKLRGVIDKFLREWVVITSDDDPATRHAAYSKANRDNVVCSSKPKDGEKGASCAAPCVMHENRCKLSIADTQYHGLRSRLYDVLIRGNRAMLPSIQTDTRHSVSDEIEFSQKDIEHGKVHSLFLRLSNPYAHLEHDVARWADESSREYAQQYSATLDDTAAVLSDQYVDEVPYEFKSTKRALVCDPRTGAGVCVNVPGTANVNEYLMRVFNHIAQRLEIHIQLSVQEMLLISKNKLMVAYNAMPPEERRSLLDTLRRKNAFWHTVRMTSLPSVDALVALMGGSHYSMSISELEVMADILQIHMFVITRATQRTFHKSVLHLETRNNIVITSPLFVVLYQKTEPVGRGDRHSRDMFSVVTVDRDIFFSKETSFGLKFFDLLNASSAKQVRVSNKKQKSQPMAKGSSS